ncbi:FliG C-terminal domain-containing protein [Thaumasiovibrio sp. DFM-14]|uniref:FliG C-terminal domain-containing protein n=1 Tax=Thaumasiovibrio sp. DFM-14 TaxID=3384792 RepID=UPI00399F27B4
MTSNFSALGGDVLLEPIEQTAILLLSMGEESAAKVLRHMSRDELLKISHAMAKQPAVRGVEARFVLQCFFDEFRAQSGISGASRAFLQRTLDKALGGQLARNLLDTIYGDEIRTTMQRLQWIEPVQLAHFLRHEHIQMQAVFIAFLPAEIASAVLAKLDGTAQEDILRRVAILTEVSREVADELKDLVDRCIEFLADNSGAVVEGERQVADIINRFTGDRGKLMESLKEHDEGLAERLEGKMYDFVILARQSEAIRSRIVEDVPTEKLALALKGAEAPLRKSLTSILPRRMLQALEAEMASLGKVSLTQVEEARKEIMDYVRELADAKEIQLQLYQETTVE